MTHPLYSLCSSCSFQETKAKLTVSPLAGMATSLGYNGILEKDATCHMNLHRRLFGRYRCSCGKSWTSINALSPSLICRECHKKAKRKYVRRLKYSDIPFGQCLFGKYCCTKCGNHWHSENAWKEKTQQCVRCKTLVKPYDLNQLKEKTENTQHSCQKSKELGFNCRDLPDKHEHEDEYEDYEGKKIDNDRRRTKRRRERRRRHRRRSRREEERKKMVTMTIALPKMMVMSTEFMMITLKKTKNMAITLDQRESNIYGDYFEGDEEYDDYSEEEEEEDEEVYECSYDYEDIFEDYEEDRYDIDYYDFDNDSYYGDYGMWKYGTADHNFD